MDERVTMHGHLEVYRVRDGVRQLMFAKRNTLYSTLSSNLRSVLISRSVEYGVDAIAWGSYSAPGGTFVDSDYAGTTGAGTKGSLKQTSVGSNQAKFSGTFSFSTQERMNWFGVGRGYTAAGGGVSALFTGLYAYDNSLLTGSTYLLYESGDSLIVDWTIQTGT